MTTITFDGTKLYTRAVRKRKIGTIVYEWTFDCITDDSANIDAIVAKAGICTVTTLLSGKTSVQTTGTSGTLVIDTESYTECAIKDPITVQELPGSQLGYWTYTVTIVRDTA